MKIVRHYRGVPEDCLGAVVAIGNFDGVHRGHQALIARANELARAKNAPSAALIFEPHPQEFFRPESGCFRLTPFRTKARLLAQNGVEVLFALPFDAQIANQDAQAFVREVLVGSLHVRGIVIGADFRFGKGRAGDAELLTQLGAELGFSVDVFAPVLTDGSKISSSDIRRALQGGRPAEAAKLLGHWWTVEGRVEHGDARGRTLGYPTANLGMNGYLRPAFGIYATRAAVLDNDRPAGRHLGVASIGIRPMFRLQEPLMEAHLFEFDGSLYGKHLAVELIAYLRPELSLASVEELKRQMEADAREARRALAEHHIRAAD